MRIIFAGSPNFAIPALSLLHQHYDICAVYTVPDTRAGRGLQLTANPVKQYALIHHLPLFQPNNLLASQVAEHMQSLQADFLVNVACGFLVPNNILSIPAYGCINIHPSLLPRWRGAAPIPHAILAGDPITGVTIMQMDSGLDTGAIWTQAAVPIKDGDTTTTLLANLSQIGAKLLLETLPKIQAKQITSVPQTDNNSTFAGKITKAHGAINWHDSALAIERKIRAFIPWPTAYTQKNGIVCKIFCARAIAATSSTTLAAEAGSILTVDDKNITVMTGDGILAITSMQLPGSKVMGVAEILKSKQQLFAPRSKFTFEPS
jgi:methionyl-tRNA formyltransferase